MGLLNLYNQERLLSEVRNYILFDQPDLDVQTIDGQVVISGNYYLRPKLEQNLSGGALANFEVQIIFPTAFPKLEPEVRELGDSIPHTEDFHVNENGTCCIAVWENWLIEVIEPTVKAYLDGPFRNFFVSQLYKKNTGEWPFGEWKHGLDGLLEAYANILNSDPNQLEVLRTLNWLSRETSKGHWNCPCGSKKITRNCCIERLWNLKKKVPHKLAERMLFRLGYNINDYKKLRKNLT